MRRPVSNYEDFTIYLIGVGRYEITHKEATVGFLDYLNPERRWLAFATVSKEHYEKLSERGEGERLGQLSRDRAFHRWVDEFYPKIYEYS